jgi:hypothetical protein
MSLSKNLENISNSVPENNIENVGIINQEFQREGEIGKVNIIEKADEVILQIRKDLEGTNKEGDTNFERVVAKGVLGFALVSALMHPQFNDNAIASTIEENNNIKNEKILDDKDGGVVDTLTERLNKEFKDFADKSIQDRNMPINYKIADKSLLEENLSNSLIGNKKVSGSLEILAEGGIQVKFNGNFENITDIPTAFKDTLEEIKGNPVKFLGMQILNVISKGERDNLDKSIDEHTSLDTDGWH